MNNALSALLYIELGIAIAQGNKIVCKPQPIVV
jgi:hypothetical protein